MKAVVIINGRARAGKDKFITYVSRHTPVYNYSSVEDIKAISTLYFGYNDKDKTDKDRKFLSDFKKLVTDYCEYPLRCILTRYKEFIKSDAEILFIHCREPKEINKIRANIKDHVHVYTLCILADRPDMPKVDNNDSDINVYDYHYDFYIDNNGTKGELKDKAAKFLVNLRRAVEGQTIKREVY
jgi:hypothetical protein